MIKCDFIGREPGNSLLKNFGAHDTAPDYQSDDSYHGVSNIERMFGKDFCSEVRDKVVIDYGSCHSIEVVEIPQHSTQLVPGIDTLKECILLPNKKAQIRLRTKFKSDEVMHFHEVNNGLNQMTIHSFKSLVEESDF